MCGGRAATAGDAGRFRESGGPGREESGGRSALSSRGRTQGQALVSAHLAQSSLRDERLAHLDAWTFRKGVCVFEGAGRAKLALLGSGCEAFTNFVTDVAPERTEVWSPEEFVNEFDSIQPAKYRPPARELTLGLLKADAREEAESQLRKRIAARYEEVRDVSASR